MDLRQSVSPGDIFWVFRSRTSSGAWQPSVFAGIVKKMDAIRPGLRKILDGQRGMLAIVLNGGAIKVGDAISVEP